MKVTTLSKNWLFRAVALMFGIICCGFSYATSVEIENPKARYSFVYEGMTFEVLNEATEPLHLELIEVSEDVKGEVILPDEFIMTWWEGSIFRPIKAVIKRIADKAFEKGSPKQITIPSSVKSIGAYALSYEPNKVTFNKGLQYLGCRAFAGSYISSIDLPESLMLIDYACFMHCSYLRRIYLPSTLKAFAGATFKWCKYLEDIYCAASVPPEADDSDFGFEPYVGTPLGQWETDPNVNKYCVIHVPEESIELYKNAPGWKNFVTFVPLTEADIIASTQQIEESAATPSQIDYTTDNGELLVTVKPGDNVSVYDTNGLCLQKVSYSAPDTFSFKGSGVVVLHINGNSVKVVL
ncbi:MAG: leucine-rich repeat domain-containing protein [Muribaculaceae bacterium]|nr:leucine-rich repeat domain-containing protein [Muribaculaceae bacterium]